MSSVRTNVNDGVASTDYRKCNLWTRLRENALSLVELADFLKQDHSSLRHAARRIERRIGTDGLLARKLEGVEELERVAEGRASKYQKDREKNKAHTTIEEIKER